MKNFFDTTTVFREKMGYPNFYLESHLEERFGTCCIDEENLLKCFKFDESITHKIHSAIILSSIGVSLGSASEELISIPETEVSIGSSYNEIDSAFLNLTNYKVERQWLEKEYPRHEVLVKAFRISKFLVTNHEYLCFLKESKYTQLPTTWYAGRYPFEFSNWPVSSVSHEAAAEFCIWRTKKIGIKTRLPTEYEWELAAGGGQWSYPWGNDYEVGKANLRDLNLLMTTPVGAFANGNSYFGCADMAGNVEEWTMSRYTPYHGGRVIKDWFYLNDNNYFITRGGSWNLNHDCARVQRRHAGWYATASGFRIVEEI